MNYSQYCYQTLQMKYLKRKKANFKRKESNKKEGIADEAFTIRGKGNTDPGQCLRT